MLLIYKIPKRSLFIAYIALILFSNLFFIPISNAVEKSNKKMIKFQFNKLVRDKTVQNLESEGIKLSYLHLNKEKHVNNLKLKLLEEAKEVIKAKDEEMLYEELGDLLDVVEALVTKANLSQKKLEFFRKTKNKKYGGFSTGTYISYCLVPNSNISKIEFFRKQPDKYIEIE